MAFWRIQRVRGSVALTYFETMNGGRTPPKQCGKTSRRYENDLVAWASEQAGVLDIIETPNGTFVRQATPSRLS